MRDYLTTAEAAKVLGVTPGRIVQFLGEGRLESQKVGPMHLIPRGSLEKFSRMKRGPKPKPRRKQALRR